MSLLEWRKLLEETCGLDPTRSILAGVSGGPDSLALLDILIHAGFQVEAAHLNHRLRDAAKEDAEVVRAEAARHGIPFHYDESEVRRLARDDKLTIEEAARIARYRFLFQTAKRINAQAVAVGHTADDQVETILMHLLRGSGLAGLRGMPWKGLLPDFDPHLPVVRPLLGMWREEVLDYCEEFGLKPVTDASNFDSAFYRNRLRHELIPFLKSYNPRVKDLLWRTGQTLQGDYAVLEDAVLEAENEILQESGNGFEKFHRQKFLAQPPAIQRGLTRRMISRLRATARDIDFGMVERTLAFVQNPPVSGEIELALGLNLVKLQTSILLKEKGLVFMDGDWPSLPDDEITLRIPGSARLIGGWELSAELIEREGFDAAGAASPGRMICWLDAAKLSDSLIVRRHKPGDRMRPYGFAGHSIKVSDIWVNTKLPRQARKSWPLVLCGDRIAWLPGYRPGVDFVVDNGTRRVARLTLRKGA